MDLPGAIVADQKDNRKSIDNLKLLTSFCPDDETSILSMEDILKDILKKFHASNPSIEIVDQGNVIDLYTRTLVDQLSSLVTYANSHQIDPSRPLFSVSQFNYIKKSVEFLIGFGIFPILEPGVVEPFWKVSDSKDDGKRRFANDMINLVTSGCDQDGQRFEKLGFCTECLFKLWDCSSSRTLVAANFLGYLLAALFQLTAIHQRSNTDSISKYKSYLDRIIDGTNRPTIIRHLMALQGKKSTCDGKKVASPTWLLSACGRLLSSFLVDEHGILIFLSTLDDIDGENSLNANWQRCDFVAALVSSRPRQAFDKDPSSYYENVCDQLVADHEIARQYSRFYVLLVQKLYAKCNGLVKSRILEPVFSVFNSCCSMLPSEEMITQAIDNLKLLYASFPVDGSFFKSLPTDIILVLIRIFFDIRNTVSHCRGTVKEVVQVFLEKAPRRNTISVVKNWLLLRLPSDCLQVRFGPGTDGGVIVVKEKNQDVLDLQERIDVLHSLMGDLSKELHGRIFDDCLNLALDQECHTETPSTSDAPVSTTLEPAEALAILGFIVSFMEKDTSLGSTNRERTAKLLTSLLEKNSDGCADDQDTELESLKTQNLLLILGLIGALFSTGATLDTEQEDMQQLKRRLQQLSDSHPDTNICSAAKDIACILFASSVVDTVPKQTSSGSSGSQSTFDQAMSDLQNPLLPIRAHALVALANLIKSKDVVACSKIDLLIPAIMDRLDEEDTYVYLAAVTCLATVGLFRPGQVLPILMTLFKSTSNLERILKVGEAVVKISRQLGDLAPFYGNDLINGFLSLLQEGDDEIKASCLANVAEICRLMSFRLNTYIHELFHCAQQSLQWEKNELVRRSAINLLALLSENGDSFLEVLGDLSRDYYRFVKDVYEHDEDQVVRLHAQKCLENLGEHVKRFLKPLIVPLD